MELLETVRQILSAENVVKLGYVVMTLVIFVETGLLVGFCLPGDSLLVTAGVFASPAIEQIPALAPYKLDIIWLNMLLVPAAIIGDTVGYWIGYHTGKRLFKREESILFHPRHLERAQQFYVDHGGKTIIIARFIPIIRTFAPVVAGIGRMNYVRFLQFNVIGGVLWVTGLTSIGYFLGQRFPWLVNSLEKLIIAIVFLSILPLIIHGVKDRLKARKLKNEVQAPPATPAEEV